MTTPAGPKYSTFARSAGFTLIEVTFALLLTLVVSAGLAAAVAYAVNSNRGATVRALANTELRRHAEALQSTSFSSLETAVANFGGANKIVTIDGASFAVDTVIEYSPSPPAQPTVKTVTITVTPQGGSQPGWASAPVSLTLQRSTQKVGAYSKN